MMNNKRILFLAACALAPMLLPAQGNAGVTPLTILSSATYHHATLDCQASDVAVNSNDEIVVTGQSGAGDCLTVLYTRNLGSPQVQTFSGILPNAVAVNNLDNVLVAGDVTVGTATLCVLLKYDSNFLAVTASTTYDGGGYVTAQDVACSGTDAVYVTGYVNNGAGYGNDYCTLKYDGNLQLLAMKTYNNDYGLRDRAYGIAVDGSGNVIVTGEQQLLTGGRKYIYTIKYDSSLQNVLAGARYDGGTSAGGAAVAVDGSGNIFIAGKQYDADLLWHYCVIKYDKDLNRVATAISETGKDETTVGIAVDAYNHVIITGKQNDGTTENYYTVKYDDDLRVLSSATYDGGFLDTAAGVAVDGQDNIIVTGISNNGSSNDYCTLKYNGSPRITAVAAACQGATGQLTITGRNFIDGTTVSFAHPGITLNSLTIVPQNQIVANITVSSMVPVGIATVTVTCGNGDSFTSGNLYDIYYGKTLTLSSDEEADVLLDGGSLHLSIPSWTFLTASSITVTAVSGDLPNTGTLTPAGLTVRIAAPQSTPQKDMTIAFTYGAALAQKLDPDKLVIAYYDETSYSWKGLVSSVTPETYTVSVTTRMINGRFTLAEKQAAAADLAAVKAYPNPYKPGSGGDYDNPSGGEGIIFANVVRDFTFRVFTIAGDLVCNRTATADSNNMYLWDTCSDGGALVASGVYIYVIEDKNSSGQRVKGKVAIIR